MIHRHWQHTVLSLILLGSLTPAVWSQSAVAAESNAAGARAGWHRSSGGRGSFGFLASMDKAVGFNAEQKDTVQGLLAQQREQTRILREGTDQKIRAILDADQQSKFDAFLAEQKAARSKRFAKTS